MNLCKEHGRLAQKVEDMDKKMDEKFHNVLLLLKGIGALALAILGILIMSLSSYNSLVTQVNYTDRKLQEIKEDVKQLTLSRIAERIRNIGGI